MAGEPRGPTPGKDPDAERLARAAAFLAAHQDEPLTPPLKVAGALALAWWALVGWQAASSWPRVGPSTDVAAGIGRLERAGDGDLRALVVGDGERAVRFGCARRGRWHWRVLEVPVVECRQAEVLFAAAQGRNVHVRFDRPGSGDRRFPRLLALTADGQPLWRPEDSQHAFGWHAIRAGMIGAFLLLPGWLMHRFWPRPGPGAPGR